MSEHVLSNGAAASGGRVVPLQGGATALSLGIETRGGTFTPLIERGTAVPCQRTEGFTTADDNQPNIKIRVFQGDGALVADNRRVGDYELMLLERAPRGVPTINVTFQIDANGVFHLLARDAAGRDVPVTMTA